MASALAKKNPSQPSAWTLRDEMAMRLTAAMVVKGGWGRTGPDGVHHAYRDMAEYSVAGYQFADHMLRAPEAQDAA